MSWPKAYSNQFQAVNGSTAAGLTNVSLKAAAARVSIYITDVIISNEGAANNVRLLNGADGTALVNVYLPANVNFAHSFKTPIKLTAATALCVTSTAADHMVVTVTGFTG